MTLTKSWLQKQITDLEATRDEIPFGLDEDGNNTLAALKMALAGMEAEHKDKAPELSRVIYHFRDWNEGFPVERFKADYVISWMLANYPPAPHPLTTSERAELENYRNAQPDMNYQHLSELYHAQEKRLFKLAQRIKGPAFDKYAHSPSQAIDVLESAIFGEREDEDCRAAMLHGKAEPVTTAYNLPVNTPCKDAPEHIWLQTAGVWPENGEFSELTWCSDNQHQDDTLYVRADVVIGNSPVIPDGWVMVPVEPTAEMLQSGISAHRERGQIQIHDRPAPGPMECAYVAMLAAAPQQEVRP